VQQQTVKMRHHDVEPHPHRKHVAASI
jgi:hypothetical protein